MNLIRFLCVSAILIIAGCNNSDVSPQTRGGGRAVSVEAMVLHPQPLENKIFTTGTLLANEEVELRPEVSGRVTGVFFEEGREVRGGDILLKINDRELQAELKRKQLEEALAVDEERRKRALHDISGISQEDYDRALNALNIIRAEREVIESQLAETEIRAPFDGVVGLRYISEGSYVTPTTLVATMQDIDPIKAEFSVPEKYSGKLTAGMDVMIQIGEAEEKHRGTIYAVEVKVDPATRTLKARATIPNPKGLLIPGSFARVEITLERIAEAIVIPTGAILPGLEGDRVFVCENGLARSVPVTTGIRTERSIQISGGLNPGDTLILTGLMQVTDGIPIQISNISGK
nr:efflux RND transporter periplasmic adaptor subunit [candidate division Zixibacteria bacterium]